MISNEAISEPDVPGAKVAILSPFISGAVYDKRDTYPFYERQEAALVDYFRSHDREPETYMRATVEDFKAVLGNPEVTTMVVTGWGNFSSICAPVSKARKERAYNRISWQDMAAMATHVKTGRAVMLHCIGYNRPEGNPPLFLGNVTSHANILGAKGQTGFAADIQAPVTLPLPITTSKNISYDEIKTSFIEPTQEDGRNRHIPGIPDEFIPEVMYEGARRAYLVLRGVNSARLRGSLMESTEVPLPPSDLSKFKQYYSDEIIS